MIELEKKNFKGCDRVSCEVLDIGTKISEQKLKDLGTFDHVMSFFCLMWVPDQETAMENIFKLVKPGGDCFIVLAANSTIIDAVTSVCESPRWKEYFIGWQDFYAFPYRKLDETKEKGMKFLKNAGFVDIKADLMTNYIKFLSDEQKVNFLSSMPNKFSKEVTKEEENEIIKERIQHLTKSQQAAKDDDNAGKYDWINWRKDGHDSLLDIGSGPGNTIREVLYPLLPINFSRLVLSDISGPMVELQKREFQGYDRVSCEVLDIGTQISDDMSKKLGTFDHVTSFFCLMWVADQQIAMDNVYKLLKPGGDCFLVIVADSPIFDAICSVCEKPRWKEYFIGWKDF
uniref:Methyltransferase type 12 domain-containing protein n=1 Tax=Phlebotomus papatasi TaxID=29031 RepID=A0A1B0F0K8_PHLPP